MNAHKCYMMMSNAFCLLNLSRFHLSQRLKSQLPGAAQSSLRFYSMPGGKTGSGAGKGGGAGGTIREAGGGLGKFAAANEEGYFFKKQKRQLEKLKDKLRKPPTPDERPEK